MQKAYSCLEAERLQPESEDAAAHDAITRLLHRMEPCSSQLWQKAQPQVRLNQGILVVDDSTLDKLTAIEDGIGDSALVWEAWTGGTRHQPDYSVMDRGRPSYSFGISVLRKMRRWRNEERPLPFDAIRRRRNGDLLPSAWCLIVGTAASTTSS